MNKVLKFIILSLSVSITLYALAPSIYIPKPVLFKDKNNLIKKHLILNQALINRINNHNDLQLDSYRLPHPILGKVSLRELAIFTSFHTIHHIDLLKSKLVR